MRSEAKRRPHGAWRRAGLAVVLASATAWAAAHATLVFGTVTTEPAPPRAVDPVTIVLEMSDPVDAPVEDAVVFVEATAPSGAVRESDVFAEAEPGVYRTEMTLPEAGEWTLLFRDQTFRQEEAQAALTLTVGPDGRREPLSFIFPPTATGPAALSTWLAWLIGLPLVAGAVVTVIVLRGGRGEDAEEAVVVGGDRGGDDRGGDDRGGEDAGSEGAGSEDGGRER